MSAALPEIVDPASWLPLATSAAKEDVQRALETARPGVAEFAALLSPTAGGCLEEMAVRSRELTKRHFGNTVSLYVPLYLSNFCSGGCLYCGFASDRQQVRTRLSMAEIAVELDAIRTMGFDEVLLLTGDRLSHADFGYLRDAAGFVAGRLAAVTIEVFPMSVEEYRQLSLAGVVGVTIYQETYDPIQYERLHPRGLKSHYNYRFETPGRALQAGMRTVGLGVLLGLANPLFDAIALFRHVHDLRLRFWQAGITLSFPRVCAQEGGFDPPFPISDRLLAQIIFAFRICLPDVPLVLSTREAPKFRDGMAGIGINKMSAASCTTVGGYGAPRKRDGGQFQISDARDVESFCAMLRGKGLEPVFKNWDSVYR